MDMQGNLIGSAKGLLGHLGCIAFNDADGKVYGSLEYKNDIIGKSILRTLGVSAQLEDAFYIAVFDVDKIDRVGMDATADGVMKTVYLKDVVDDFKATVSCGGKETAHRYGCSGIDGTTFAPMPGSNEDKKYLFVAYGIYRDTEREDNDHQVILCYDIDGWDKYAQPLSQYAMHKSGPAAPLKKLFVYTGNTNYGVPDVERHRKNLNILFVDGHVNTFNVGNVADPYAIIGGKNCVQWTGGRKGVETDYSL
jgi:prepilin-type processing-associated H-X9-DG protein